MMTYRQIEASREARLWITQVVVPAVALTTALVMMNPDLKEAVARKANDVKDKIVNALHK